jgi:nucleolar MIF4G domain-containing protein 1
LQNVPTWFITLLLHPCFLTLNPSLLLPGTWWLPSATDAKAGLLPTSLLQPDALDGPGVLVNPSRSKSTVNVDQGDQAAAGLLAAAAAMRMNTDVRRAVFLAVMGSEDVVDAFEKLLRLPLKGEQVRGGGM